VVKGLGFARSRVHGYLAHKQQHPPLGPTQGPRHSPTVGSYGSAVSYERGTPVEAPPERHAPDNSDPTVQTLTLNTRNALVTQGCGGRVNSSTLNIARGTPRRGEKTGQSFDQWKVREGEEAGEEAGFTVPSRTEDPGPEVRGTRCRWSRPARENTPRGSVQIRTVARAGDSTAEKRRRFQTVISGPPEVDHSQLEGHHGKENGGPF